MSKPFAELIKDHKKVKILLEEMMSTTSGAKQKRKNMLDELKQELKLHEEIEEEHVYPILEQKKQTHDLALEAYEEHHLVDEILSELEDLDVTDEEWKAKLTVLQENLEHHIKEEETELFAKAEEILSDEQLTKIDEEIEDAKNESRH